MPSYMAMVTTGSDVKYIFPWCQRGFVIPGFVESFHSIFGLVCRLGSSDNRSNFLKFSLFSAEAKRLLANERPRTLFTLEKKIVLPITSCEGRLFTAVNQNGKCFSMYIINRKHHGKCFVQFLFTRFAL